jgi:murein DD-endopeptidase MepM/ murein hydrolase activator NlpD
MLIVERTADGPRARRAVLPYFMEVKGLAGRIHRGLREDATGSGVPESVVSEIADIFGWELDVSDGLLAGDEFRVLYENIWQAGESRAEPGKVLGAEIVARGRPITAVLFEDADGRGAYYEPSGAPISREFLRYPVEFTEISSDFSLRRRHPILRLARPHLGVDFAAPVGTPVRAVASGTVTAASWVNQLGRAVRIGHTASLESVYGHLSRIAVREGAAVERGQVIGYVGATGLATGPHLHFAVYRDGEYVDPLASTGASAEPIPFAARRRFERVRTAVTHQLAALPKTEQPLTVSLSTAALRPE